MAGTPTTAKRSFASEGSAARERGDYAEAERLLLAAIERAGRECGPDSLELAALRRNLTAALDRGPNG